MVYDKYKQLYLVKISIPRVNTMHYKYKQLSTTKSSKERISESRW